MIDADTRRESLSVGSGSGVTGVRGDKRTLLRAHEIVLAKALEVVRETLAQAEHDRENTLSHIVDRVKSMAQRTGNTSILATFEQTLSYTAQYATKAAETRRKNGKAKAKPVKEPAP